MVIKKLRFLLFFALIINQINIEAPLHAMQPNHTNDTETSTFFYKFGSFLSSTLSGIKQLFSTAQEQNILMPMVVDSNTEETSTETRPTKRKIPPTRKKHPTLKRQKTQPQPKSRIIDLTQEENDLHSKNISSLWQKDGWSCGYFAVFHGLWMLKAAQQNPNLDDLDLSHKQEIFNNWLQNVLSNSNIMENLYVKEQLLKTGYIELLISLSLKKALNEIKNISIIERKNFNINKLRPTFDGQTINNIKNFRKTGEPQLIIIHDMHHWTACLLTKEGMWQTDSLPSDNKTRIIEKEIYTFFTSKKLIDHQIIKELTQKIKLYLKSNYQKDLIEAQEFACQHQIATTEFSQLLNKIKKQQKNTIFINLT